jgi:hypothetical protein
MLLAATAAAEEEEQVVEQVVALPVEEDHCRPSIGSKTRCQGCQ